MPPFIVLNHFVRLDEETSPSLVARAIGAAKGAMPDTMARLEHKDYIAIRPDPDDGRGKLAMITPAGRAVRQRAVVRLGQALALLAATLPADLDTALGLLRDMGSRLDQNR
jgi:DNA-binding MarR family transcriptional regulator